MTRGRAHRALDWATAEAVAYRLLRKTGAARVTEDRVRQMPLDGYWTEPIQNAVVQVLAAWREGRELLPATTPELAECLARRAKWIDDNRRQVDRNRLRLQKRNADAIKQNFPMAPETRAFRKSTTRRDGAFDAQWTVDMFRSVASRDLFGKLMARLYDDLDDDGRLLLNAWLDEGIELLDTAALCRRFGGASPQHIHNIKRRMKYRAGIILVELSDIGPGELS